ncbi:hypothetical protein B7494_g3425 [Chlorociboria aeruginascens]|nr:hypothetical protein B7494_g3425 [Chlorociboria aeruginascens]
MSSADAKTFRSFTSAQVIRLHQIAIAPAQPSQPAMLESAMMSPMNIKHYEKKENVFHLAANLAEKIMKNHAYQDGNKRTALLAANGIVNAHVAVTISQWDAKELGRISWTPDLVSYRDAATEY